MLTKDDIKDVIIAIIPHHEFDLYHMFLEMQELTHEEWAKGKSATELQKDQVNAIQEEYRLEYTLERLLSRDPLYRTVANLASAPTRLNKEGLKNELIHFASLDSDDRDRAVRAVQRGNKLEDACECAQIRVGSFDILEILGSGVFGKTYLMANIGAENKLHALKVPHRKRERALKLEARVHNAMGRRHDNIAEMYAIIEAREPYRHLDALDMEYVRGETLRSLIDRCGRLHGQEFSRIAQGILRGLAFIHLRGILHRDLKPDNVMIDEDGVPKLLDFGLSTCSEISEQPRMNRLYGPPEFRIGEESRTSDIWSIGLILFEMCTGKNLFEPSAPDVSVSVSSLKDRVANMARMWAIIQGDIDKRYRKRIVNECGKLTDIIVKCLRVNPNERYETCDDILADLKRKSIA